MRPIIAKSVYKKISALLKKMTNPEGKLLRRVLLKAKIVNDKSLNKNIITLNSEVEFIKEDLNKPMKVKLVLPHEADLSQRKISIFTPIGIALIGFKESYTFDWLFPSGRKKLKILRVTNS